MNSSPSRPSSSTLRARAGRHVAGEVDEARVAADELAQEVVLVAAEQRREAAAPSRRVLDEVRRGGDGDGGLGDGQLDAVAVHDRAAAGGDDDVGHLLRGRGAPERVGLDEPEPAGAAAGEQQHGEEDGEEEPDASLDDAHRLFLRRAASLRRAVGRDGRSVTAAVGRGGA